MLLAACGGGASATDGGLDASLSDAPAMPDAVEGPDAFEPPDAWPRCGDGTAEGGEACDDGNRRANDGCGPTCELECGDGRVSGEELCDTAIPGGAPGACPSSCDDAIICTLDQLIGVDCTAECASSPITLPDDGDGCCPPGASSLTDADCPVVCGNGLLEAGELCDTAIEMGAGRCPTSCDDGAVCTADALLDADSCTARCTAMEVTAARDGDGCCPLGATVGSDDDCSPLCGDGVFSPSSGEVCDTAIASGEGSCPSACDDSMICTADVLVAAGTCTASCTHTPLPPTAGDGCCPAGATIGTDADCPARCGDRVRTAPEACDDGNLLTGDGCSPTCTREPRAYRITSIGIQDPRILNDSGFDVTPEINVALRSSMMNDLFGPRGGPDGVLDLSIVIRFDPLDQDAATLPVQVDFPRCTAPLASTSCSATMPVPNTATNSTMGTCAGPYPDTIPPGRVVNTPTAPCFVTDVVPSFSLLLGGSSITFDEAQLAAQYVGDPSARLVTGLMRGFLTEANAALVVLDGENSAADVLRASDRDVLDGVGGWWFYLQFTAEPVAYSYP